MQSKRSFLRGVGLAAVFAAGVLASDSAAYAASQPVVLPTGATITPDAAPGSVFQPLTVALPDYPNYSPDSAETTAVSPDGKTLLILTSGFNLNLDVNGNYQPQDSSEYIFVYDISSPGVPVEKQVVLVPRAFGGLVWSPDGSKFYVAGGADDNIHTYAVSNGQWAEAGTPISLGHAGDLMSKETFVGPTAAGVGITADGTTVVVANYETDSITVVDVVHGTVLAEYDLRPGRINPAQSGVPGGEFPVGVAVKGNNTIFVSSARDREIDVLNLSGGKVNLTSRIPVSGNPNRLVLNKAQSLLYVAANNSDALIVIDANGLGVLSQVNVSAPVGVLGNGKNVPRGSNPNSITLSPDEKTAYVTNGGTNDVAVVSLSGKKPVVKGLIPTGWQPNSVSVSADGSTIYVVNGKSLNGANPLNCRYINAGGNYGSACQNPQAQNGSGNQYAWQNMQAGFLVLPGVAARKAWQPLYPNDPDLLPGTANEVAADGPKGEEGLGYIWDSAIRAGLKVRNYGFFLDLGAARGIDPNIVDPCSAKPPVQVAFPAHPSLLKRTDLCFRGYNNQFPDFFRYKEWTREFNKQVKSDTFPALTLLRLSHDHFGNFGSAVYGVNTPELQMADNDYAVGLVADKIAHSPYANNTLIFVIEDDPQDGADHVSGNRSLGFVIGPYVKQGAVVSDHYATVNMLRTIEEVLGISKLGVHDAGVPPMTNAFDTSLTSWTYSAVPAQILFTTQLPILNKYVQNNAALPHPTHDAAWWEAKTKGFDFSVEDRIDSDKFNRIIWQGLKGDVPYPTTRSGDSLRQFRGKSSETATPNVKGQGDTGSE